MSGSTEKRLPLQKDRLGKKDSTTADTDIIRRRWLPIDIDPVRPSRVSSTDAEHTAALDRAVKITGFLHELGWLEPVSGDSGNGAHLLYRVDLPNDVESRDLVKDSLMVLTRLFSDDQANVDTANLNAARIWKLYGTISRKGDHTKGRPHRRSGVPDSGAVCLVGREGGRGWWLIMVYPDADLLD